MCFHVFFLGGEGEGEGCLSFFFVFFWLVQKIERAGRKGGGFFGRREGERRDLFFISSGGRGRGSFFLQREKVEGVVLCFWVSLSCFFETGVREE